MATTNSGDIILGSALDRALPDCGTDAAERRIGVEIEFGGLTLDDVTERVAETFGGTVTEDGLNAFKVEGTNFGAFTVELDADILQRSPKADGGEAGVLENLQDGAVRLAGKLSAGLVPIEVVTPPLPIGAIETVDRFLTDLRAEGAEDTGASPLNGYGLHLNPSVASEEGSHICRVLKAFLLLEEALWRDIDVDMTRKISPFIDRFPDAYAEKVVDPDYAPSLDTLIDDYLADNATRNRDLDMLPLFAELAPGRLEGKADLDLVKARPTYHYRLPDCRLNDPDWSIGREWRRWRAVEVLAGDGARLEALACAYLGLERGDRRSVWPTRLREELQR